jgi:hypothetical protein
MHADLMTTRNQIMYSFLNVFMIDITAGLSLSTHFSCLLHRLARAAAGTLFPFDPDLDRGFVLPHSSPTHKTVCPIKPSLEYQRSFPESPVWLYCTITTHPINLKPEV